MTDKNIDLEKELLVENGQKGSNSKPEETDGDKLRVEEKSAGSETKPKRKRGLSTKKLQDEISKLKKMNETLTEENANLKDQYLRLLAEFDNFRKRKLSENASIIENTKKDIILELLPVLDDVDRFYAHSQGNSEKLMDGINLIVDKLRKTLEKYGLKQMDSLGKEFDPDLHDALMMTESKEHKSGIVVEVHQPGYLLGDNVLRHAKVIVSK